MSESPKALHQLVSHPGISGRKTEVVYCCSGTPVSATQFYFSLEPAAHGWSGFCQAW